MEELIREFDRVGVRYLLIGGQAMRLEGMPRFSMDWDFFIPPRDTESLSRLNDLLADELDMPVEPLGSRGENHIQTYQTRWGIIQFHLGVPGVPPFEQAEQQCAIRRTETGIEVRCLSTQHLLASKLKANRPQDQSDILFLQEKLKAQG
ncbi:MAG TPA: nucleotidyl transferase AbiEii/AbiGii toxin family protein [Candidatus Paceibacterota bacterium]|nr:nucleotidyl transferase AbiEii/AbiGii toxin family protein [Candidatus Paceibacterota bacterium]